ncbi:MAG: NAD(P)-binding domain-containing protein [Blastocatellia bacterium]
MHDLVIVGGGPAGLSAALAAKRRGLNYLVLERGAVADTITRFPIAKKLFSTANELELRTGDLDAGYKPTREELLDYYYGVVIREGLNIKPGVDVEEIDSTGSYLTISSSAGVLNSRTVVVAVGGFGIQRRLDVSGENPATVSYRFAEVYPSARTRVLVVGGGNSAAESALSLAETGARVTLSVRRSSLDLPPTQGDGLTPQRAQIKPWVRGPLDRAINEGKINLMLSSKVVEIGPGFALLEREGDDEQRNVRFERIECDHTFALIGADPDTRLLTGAGARIAPDGRPVYDTETFETTVPRLYVAGHLTRERHIKNAISIARRVVERLGAKVLERCEV